MSRFKNLFIFAGYDKEGIIDTSLVFYIKSLSQYGDVIAFIDSDATTSTELDKIKPYTIFAEMKRHGEYDFGSYKRGFLYAKNKNILSKYQHVYLVNDSVYGPLFDIKDVLNKMEHIKTDAVGITVSTHRTHSYMESWFILLNKPIFTSDWFNDFMSNITKQIDKNDVTIKYEHGLSNLIREHNCTWSGLYVFRGCFTYNNPKYLFQHGCPLIKKMSFSRHYGGYGGQIKYILNNINIFTALTVLSSVNRIYGKQQINKLLTYNPIKLGFRKIMYGFYKIIHGGI